MSRFKNKIVVGGSDRESSESEDEYMSGQEMVNLKYAQQCMYNATMYNVMIQNMMPCFPMQCIPAYGYPMPYPTMINEFPVNHPMAAGTYYRKGGRQHRYRRDKMKSRSRLERDDEKYRPYHKQHHVVSRHQYYEPSSESDCEDECIYTGEKGVPACKSVNHKITHITDNYHSTLSRSNPAPSGHGDKPRQQNNRSTSRVKSGIAATRTKMPSHNPNSKSAVIACQQGEHTMRPMQPDVHIVVNTDSDHELSRQSPSVVSSLYSDISSQTTTLAASEGDQGQQTTTATTQETMPVCITQERNTAANSLPLSEIYPDMVPNDTTVDREPQNVDEVMKPTTQNVSTASIVKTNVSMEPGRVTSSPSQPHSNTAVQMVIKSERDDSMILVHPQNPAVEEIWRSETCTLKYLQSLHNLRKMWAEWETKYRPPPVSIYSCRGAGPN